MNPTTIRIASERIRRAISQYRRHQINEAAACEIVRQAIAKIEPILQPFDKLGVLWPAPIGKLVLTIHESGLNVPFIEKMYRRQDFAGIQ